MLVRRNARPHPGSKPLLGFAQFFRSRRIWSDRRRPWHGQHRMGELTRYAVMQCSLSTKEELRIYLEYMVGPQIRRFCGPIFFTKSLATASGNVVANGSFTLVDTGSKKLLVTCYHVWEEFQKALLEYPNLHMCVSLDLGPPVVLHQNTYIAGDADLDIATFDMETLLAACGGREFFPLHRTRARKVEKGDTLFLVGFPGHLRNVRESDGALGWGRSPFGVSVCSVDGWRFHADASKLQVSPDQFGGVSGCPCCLVRKGRPVHLVGFTTSVVLHKYLGFTHALCLNRDGTLSKAAFASK